MPRVEVATDTAGFTITQRVRVNADVRAEKFGRAERRASGDERTAELPGDVVLEREHAVDVWNGYGLRHTA